jgi:general secretion pathway protein D
VLSSPHILTTNNQEAEISVGENIPYQSGFSNFGAGAGGLALPVQSVQRQDVALTLKITPHINASDMVRLEIDQEISDIASRNFEGLGPSWAKRAIKTTVVVRDQQSIVIGGLISDRVTYSESKIPLLGDVPILGYLFKYSQKSKAKTNLLVLLTPYVIKDQMDIEEIVQRKVRERSEFVRAYSTFASRREVGTQVDYRRKRGLLEEMNRTLQAIEKDVIILREAEMQRDVLPDGIIELRVEGGISVDADSEDSAEGAFDPSRAGEGGIEDGN